VSTDARQSRPARYSVCWVLSIAIHGMVVGAALALVSDLTLPPSQERFSWDVAVVEKPAPPEPAAPAPPPVTPTPPEPQPVKTPVSAKPRPIKHEPILPAQQPVQAAEPREAVRPVQEVQQPQEIQPARETRPVQEVRPVREAQLQQTLQPVQQAAQELATAVTRPVQDESRPAREVTQSVSHNDASVETAEPAERPLQTAQPLMRGEQVEVSEVQDHAVTSVPSVTQHTTVEESQVPVEAAPKVEQPVVARHTPAVHQRTVQHMPVRAKPAARPDYGWLAQALWANVDQRKRYPAEAKLNRWEGNVVLRLTIEQRGTSVHLLDLTLEESSGHAVLDKHTQEMVRKAFPLEVKHALSQPRIQLHVPFSYSMQ
jgi:protein TonB